MNLDIRFKLLLTRPLFLFIFIEILNAQDGYSIPNNTALLFDNFFCYPLRQKQLSATEINLTGQILSCYAEWLMENQESDAKLIEYIHGIVGDAQTEKYLSIVNKSGIVIEGINGLRFFHNTFLEYFFAKHIVQYKESTIIEFLEAHVNNTRYREIICFMVGIISNENKQNVVLDYLQEHNLALFIKALNSRYKFSSTQTDKDYGYSKSYFTQIRDTYLQIIDTYFFKIKGFFFPFNLESDEENQKLKLIGKIDTVNYGISVNLVCAKNEDADIECSALTSVPKMYVGNDKQPTPIFSMSNNNGHYYFDLAALSLGLDSAREIAVNMIKDQLFKFIKDKTILDLNCPVLMVECIEDVLDHLRKRHLLPPQSVDLSLANNPDQVLAFLFANRDKPTIHSIGFHGPAINFELLYLYCYMLINMNKELNKLVLPKQDLNSPNPGGKKAFYFHCYSDEQLVNRVKKIVELTKSGYEELVLVHFPALYDQIINSTKYFFQYIKLNCSGTGWEISKTKISTSAQNKGVSVMITDSISGAWETSNDEKQILLEIGATEKDIISRSQGMLHEYFSENVLHNFIYRRLEADFKIIFEGKQ